MSRTGILDTRDLNKRLEELESERDSCTLIREDGVEEPDPDGWADQNPEDAQELKELEELRDEIPEWRHGDQLIPDDEFEDYARQLAEDIGAIERTMAWPCNCIDWEQAASELKSDYSCISFQGEDYWYRI